MLKTKERSYDHVQRGKYLIGDTEVYFRSKWEANYALYLEFLKKNGKIKSWEFEPDTFVFEKIKFGTRSYKPDFKVVTFTNAVEYHEIKGYLDSVSKTKLKRMAKYYPSVKIILIEKEEYKAICEFKNLLKFY